MRIETTERIVFERGDVVEWKPEYENRRGQRRTVHFQSGDMVHFIGVNGEACPVERLQLVTSPKPVKHCVKCGREVTKGNNGQTPRHVELTPVGGYRYFCSDYGNNKATIHGTWDTPDPEPEVGTKFKVGDKVMAKFLDYSVPIRAIDGDFAWIGNNCGVGMRLSELTLVPRCPHATKVCQACQEVVE